MFGEELGLQSRRVVQYIYVASSIIKGLADSYATSIPSLLVNL